GPYTGLSGVAFALEKAGPVAGSSATALADQLWKHCNSGSRRSSSKQARFLCGDLGVYVTQMCYADLRENLVSKIEKLSDVLARDDYPSDEILVGRAGYLSGVLWIRQMIDSSLVSNDCVQKVLSAMILSGKSWRLIGRLGGVDRGTLLSGRWAAWRRGDTVGGDEDVDGGDGEVVDVVENVGW
ncbi:hypothetical protein TELCIR_23198, partial [Teladorsagia circumcincta]